MKRLVAFFLSVLMVVCGFFLWVQYLDYRQHKAAAESIAAIRDTMVQIQAEVEDYKYFFSIPEKYRRLCSIFNDEGLRFRLQYSLFQTESEWNPKAINVNVNGTFDSSLAQLNSAHIDEFRKLPGCAGFDPQNPYQNAEMGFKYLLFLYKLWEGDLQLAVASYNEGPVHVTEAGGLDDWAYHYVKTVLTQPSKFDSFERVIETKKETP
jgi:hypothetical protein